MEIVKIGYQHVHKELMVLHVQLNYVKCIHKLLVHHIHKLIVRIFHPIVHGVVIHV